MSGKIFLRMELGNREQEACRILDKSLYDHELEGMYSLTKCLYPAGGNGEHRPRMPGSVFRWQYFAILCRYHQARLSATSSYSEWVFRRCIVVVIAGYALFVSIPWLKNDISESGAAELARRGGAML
jgi:hypothetical protein